MKKLILVQSLINVIEMETLEVKYRSKFNYKDDKHLIIETFCKQQSIAYMEVFDRMPNTAWYFRSNTEIEVFDLGEDVEI